MSYPAFEKLDKSTLAAQPVRGNKTGLGKTVMLDCSGARGLRFSTPKDMRQKWNIAPAGMNAEIGPDDKMVIDVEIGPEHSEFASKCVMLDQFVMEQAFSHKKDWFGDKNASRMDTIDALKLTYTKLVSEGKADKTGSKYPDSIKFKIEGWAPYLETVITHEEGARKGMPKQCVWKNRIIDDLKPLGVDDKETKFFLFEKKCPVTNTEEYIYKLPVVDPAMNQLKGVDGNGMWRYVGPQDCKPNSRIRIVFAAQRVWISDIRFGIALTAKEIWIKPPPPPTVQKLDGVRVNPKVDLASAMKLITSIQTVEMNADFDDDEEELIVHKHVAEPVAQLGALGAQPMDIDEPVGAGTEKADVKSPEPKRRKKAAEPKPQLVDSSL
jgi:hypothetical protein